MIDFGSLAISDRHAPPRAGTPRFLFIANASGRSWDHGSELRGREIFNLDRDNLDETLERLSPTITFAPLISGGESSELIFESIDFFEPDYIFNHHQQFESLRTLKRQLKGASAKQAIAEIQSWATLEPATTPPPPSAPHPSADPLEQTTTRENWFAQVLEETRDSASESESIDWDRFVKDLLSESRVQSVEPDLDVYMALLDKTIEKAMQNILHDPKFRSIESTWRSLDWLVRRVDSDRGVQVHVLDVTHAEMCEDLNRASDLTRSNLFQQLFVESVGTPGGQPWSLVCSLADLSGSSAELSAAGRLTKIGAAAKSAVLLSSPASDACWQDVEFLDGWEQLRGLSESSFLCCVFPRFLLRWPYGKGGAHTDAFSFTERGFLWGQGAMLGACALAADQSQASSINPTQVFTLGDLPMHPSGDNGPMISGEVLLTDQEIALWLERGITPLVSYKDTDQIRINGFQSVRRTPWTGPWTH